MEEKRIVHALNCFKLMGLIIVTSALRVLELLINEQTEFEKTYILPQIPLICEYLVASLTIYIIGFLLWLMIEKKMGN